MTQPRIANKTEIGLKPNPYGVHYVGEADGKFYWTIGASEDIGWEEIPEYLYNAILKFHKEYLALSSQQDL